MRKRINKLARRLALLLLRSRLYGNALLIHDRLAVSGIRRTTTEASYELVITPTGNGNIGDQAMLDSIIKNTSGPLLLVSNHRGALRVAEVERHRVSVVALPKLIKGLPILRISDVRRFARLAANARNTYIPGADTIDGGHPHTSLARLNAAFISAHLGTHTRVQGFSWSSEAPPSVVKLAQGLSTIAVLLPRDPVSASRLAAGGVEEFTPTSDLVFSYDERQPLPQDLQDYIDDAQARDKQIVVVNMSGLIARKQDLLEDYMKTIDFIRGQGHRVIFLPHVLRDGDNDLDQIERLIDHIGAGGDYVVREELTPAQVKQVTSQVALSVTGRMHLAIMSLSECTPAITLATVGKVEGLYDFFDLPDLVVQPRPGCSESLTQEIHAVIASSTSFRERIATALPQVRELSALNFPVAKTNDPRTAT